MNTSHLIFTKITNPVQKVSMKMDTLGVGSYFNNETLTTADIISVMNGYIKNVESIVGVSLIVGFFLIFVQ